GSRFSPLTQITPANVGSLQVAWTFDTGSPGTQVTPVVAGGSMYLSVGSTIISLDPDTGQVRWKFDAHAVVSRRGGAYGPGGANTGRDSGGGTGFGTGPRIFSGAGDKLLALDAKSGNPVRTFGAGGFVDLKTGVRGDVDGRLSLMSPPAIYKNI